MSQKDTKVRYAKAFRAMAALGIPEDNVKPVLESLLDVYDRNWPIIEDENYRVLADAVFDVDEPQAVDPLNGKTPSDQVPGRPSKRSRLGSHDCQPSTSKTPGCRVSKTLVIGLRAEKDVLTKPPHSKPAMSCDVTEATKGHRDNRTVNLPDVQEKLTSKGKGTQSVHPRTPVLVMNSDAGNSSGVSGEQHHALSTMKLRERAKGSVVPQVPSTQKRPAPESASLSVPVTGPKVELSSSFSPKRKNSTRNETMTKSSVTNGQEMKMQKRTSELRSRDRGSGKPSDVIQANGSMKKSSSRDAHQSSASSDRNLNDSSSPLVAEPPRDRLTPSFKTSGGRIHKTSIIGLSEETDAVPKSPLSKPAKSCNVAEATKGHREHRRTNFPDIPGHSISKGNGTQSVPPGTSVIVKNSDAGHPSGISREKHHARSTMTLREKAKESTVPQVPSTKKRPAPESASLCVSVKDPKVEPSANLSPKRKISTSNETMNKSSATSGQGMRMQRNAPDVIQANGSMKKSSSRGAQVSPGSGHTNLNGPSSPSVAELPHGKCVQVSSSMGIDCEIVKDENDQKKFIKDLESLTSESSDNPHDTPAGIRPLSSMLDIAKGQEKVVITLVNEVNNELPPSFCYIPQNEVFEKAYVNFCLARIGDDNCCGSCSGDCLASPFPCACATESGGEFAYTTNGVVTDRFLKETISMNLDPRKHYQFFCKECPLERSKCEDTINPCKGHLVRKFIKECWRKCGCGKQCGNRVVQRGITRNLQVFMTPEGKGWGLRTLEDLPKGAFVCEYVGEVLTNAELFERVSRRQEGEKHSYPVLLDADWCVEGVLKDEEALCLDATYYGNVARFINHRCYDANLVEIPVEVEGPDHHYYHLAFFTTRKVKAMEELTWDYGIDFDDHEHPIKAFQCQCGSKSCRNLKRTRSRTSRR